MKMRPFFVIGTRPEIIKMAPLLWYCDREGIDYFFLHTGQHYSKFMSESFFQDMNIRNPHKNLNIGSGTQSEQTAKAMIGIEKELMSDRPDVVLVQGDTNAVLSAALTAAKLHIPVGHVEAGLRSYDIRMPEEHNRRLTDHVSQFLFAPTEKSAEILRSENVWGKIYVTGNTVIDAIENRVKVARERPLPKIIESLDEFVLLTMHRAENVDDKSILEGIVEGILSLDMDIVFPIHPRTVKRLNEFSLMDRFVSNGSVHLIEPVGYLDFLNIMSRCKFIMTDSGGIQEEATAPSMNKRVFVLRTSTERPEAVKSGHATVVGVDPGEFPRIIQSEIKKGLDKKRECPYGDGRSGERIMKILSNNLD